MYSPTYRPDIDGLRAIAVISVILFHLDLLNIDGGYLGVDIFFVISGFLITQLIATAIEKQEFSFATFYSRRARRLFPALFFTWCLCAIFAILLFSPGHLERFGGSLLHSILSISNFYFWGESGYFDADAIVKPLLHTWSLSVEEQFYLVWPLFLVFLIGKMPRNVAIMTIAVLGMASFFIAKNWQIDDPSGAFFLMPFRIIEFSIGALLIWGIKFRPSNDKILEILVLVGLCAIFYSIIELDKDDQFPDYRSLIPVLGAGLIIYAGPTKYIGCVLQNPVSVKIGLISYSLYLIHWPLIVFYQYYKFDEIFDAEKYFIFISSIIFAYLMYKFIEQPFRHKKLSSNHLSAPAFGFVCVCLALCLSFVAGHIWANDGWKWRMNEQILSAELSHAYSEYENDYHKALYIRGSDGSARSFGVGQRSKETSRKVLVIGDSHAKQHKYGFDYLGKKYGLSIDVYTSIGCPPIFNTYKIFGPSGVDAPPPRQKLCFDQTEKWEKYIQSNQFDYVVLASRWAWLYEPVNYGKFHIRRDLLVSKSSPEFSVEASKRTFKKYLAYTINKIKDSGAKVILFSQVPNHGKHLEGCDNIPKFIIDDTLINKRCTGVTKSVALDRLKFTNEIISNLSDNKDVFAVIASDYFCVDNKQYCLHHYNGVRLSDDDDHVNQYGSIYLMKQWEADSKFPFD